MSKTHERRTTAVETSAMRPDIFGIQYLRGLAAILVVIFHVSLQLKGLAGEATLDTLQSGVDIFFVISGFVMVLSTDAGRRSTSSKFLLKRIIRIVPLYWASTMAMIAVLIVAPQFVKQSKLVWDHAFASLAFVARENPASPGLYGPLVAPGWTLNLEILFYLFFAIVLRFGRDGVRLVATAGAPVIALSAIGIIVQPGGIAGFYTNPIMLEFVFGMGLGLVFLAGRFRLPPSAAAVIVVIGLALLILPPPMQPVYRALRYGLPALAIVAGSLWVAWPRWNAFHHLGDASYSIYLTHFFLLSALAQIWKRLDLMAPVEIAIFYPTAIAGCVVLGSLCWRFIERPLTDSFRGWIGLMSTSPPADLR